MTRSLPVDVRSHVDRFDELLTCNTEGTRITMTHLDVALQHTTSIDEEILGTAVKSIGVD